MKTLATILQLLALSACFTVYVSTAGEIHLAGMRRAMQTAAGMLSQVMPVAPANLTADVI